MEALKLKAKTADYKLVIAIPEALNNKDVEILVWYDDVKVNEKEKNDAFMARKEKMKSLIGKAKYPNFPTTKYDVYNQ